MVSHRVWGSVLFTILWVLFGNIALSVARVGGLLPALPFLTLFIIALVGIWREREKRGEVLPWKLWVGWLIALVWTLLVTAARLIRPEDVEAGIGRFVLLLFGSETEGLELAIRDAYIAISITLLVWSGLELGIASYRARNRG